MRFLIDANLPPSLAVWLGEKGHDAAHVIDLGLAASTDIEIWRHASETNAVIVTKDEDFALLKAANSYGPNAVWIRIGNSVRRVLLARLADAWPVIIAELETGAGVIEVR